MRKRPALTFILLAYALSWTVFAVGKWGLGVQTPMGWLLIGVLFMFGPAMATMVLRRPQGLTWKQLGMAGQGIRWPWVGMALLIAMAMPLLTLFFSWFLGDVAGIGAFGHVAVTKDMFLATLSEQFAQADRPAGSLGPTVELLDSLSIGGPLILLFLVVLGALAGGVINLVAALGEELGWRGLLFHHTRPWGLWKHVLFTGIVWGLWHAPLILQGHNYPDHPHAGVFLMCLLCTAMALPMAWVRHRANSIWAAGVLHGAINGVAGIILLFNPGGSDLFGGAAGVSAALAFLAIGGLLFLFDRTFPKEFGR